MCNTEVPSRGPCTFVAKDFHEPLDGKWLETDDTASLKEE